MIHVPYNNEASFRFGLMRDNQLFYNRNVNSVGVLPVFHRIINNMYCIYTQIQYEMTELEDNENVFFKLCLSFIPTHVK